MKFGVAGYPIAFSESEYGKDRLKIFDWLQELDLDALELQMTYGPRMKPEKCLQYRALSEEYGIKLSVHAAYYIVLTSDDAEKVDRSIDTLKRTFGLADLLGADTVVLHPGPLYGQPAQTVESRFVENAGRFIEEIGKTNIGLYIETAGKLGQLGSVSEILSISKQLSDVYPCIDFGHVHARTLGGLEAKSAIRDLVGTLRSYLSGSPGSKIHFHYTPIHFGQRGEIQHRSLEDRYPQVDQLDLFGESAAGQTSVDGLFHPRPEPVIHALLDLPVEATVISETHNSQEQGARALKQCYTSCKSLDLQD